MFPCIAQLYIHGPSLDPCVRLCLFLVGWLPDGLMDAALCRHLRRLARGGDNQKVRRKMMRVLRRLDREDWARWVHGIQ